MFYLVRDIEFKIPLSFNEESRNCSGKHKKLLGMLRDKGFEVRYRVCSFRWSELGLPDWVLEIEHEDECLHVYLEVLIDGKWVVLDATWDKGLRELFEVNEWDGKSDTKVGVNVIRVYSALESEKIMSKASEEEFNKDIEKNGKFYEGINQVTGDWREETERI